MDADSFVGQREFRPKAERTLEKADWIKDSKVSGTTIQSSLNDMDPSSYDQFAGKKSTFDESKYNTTYDEKSLTKEQKERALQIEREITGDVASNRHLAEERGQKEVVEEVDDDEEMIYSAMVKDPKLANPRKFTALKPNLADKSVFAKIDAAINARVNERSRDKIGGILCN